MSVVFVCLWSELDSDYGYAAPGCMDTARRRWTYVHVHGGKSAFVFPLLDMIRYDTVIPGLSLSILVEWIGGRTDGSF